MINALFSAVAGLRAASTRLSTSADNVANMRTTGHAPTPGDTAADKAAYQAKTVQQTTTGTGQPKVVVRPKTPATHPLFDPTHEEADAKGMVAAPNVDLAAETVEQMIAQTSYEANLATIRTADEMTERLLDIKS